MSFSINIQSEQFVMICRLGETVGTCVILWHGTVVVVVITLVLMFTYNDLHGWSHTSSHDAGVGQHAVITNIPKLSKTCYFVAKIFILIFSFHEKEVGIEAGIIRNVTNYQNLAQQYDMSKRRHGTDWYWFGSVKLSKDRFQRSPVSFINSIFIKQYCFDININRYQSTVEDRPLSRRDTTLLQFALISNSRRTINCFQIADK